MKVTPQTVNRFLKEIPEEIKVILFYGPDGGLIMERIKISQTSFLGEGGKDSEVIQIFESTLKESPEKLREEAYSVSLFDKGKRVIILRDVKDSTSKLIKEYLENVADDCLVLIQGNDFAPSSSLRKLCESSEKAASVPCYLDTPANLRQYISEVMKEHNFNIERDALEYLVLNLGNDRGITRQELDKLILYKHKDKHISLMDVEESVVSSSSVYFDKLIFSFFNLKREEAYKYLSILMEDNNAITIIRVLVNHLNKIFYVKSLMEQGISMDSALKELRPPIFFANLDAFKGQLRLWEIAQLSILLDILLDAEISAKSQSYLGDLVLKNLILKKTW